MVIAVNGWMNHPSGFRLAADGDVTDVHPWSALFGNSFFWHELVHMYVAGVHRRRLRRRGRLRVRAAAARQLGPLRAHRAGDPADDRRAGRAGAAARRRLGGARGRRRSSRPSSPPSRACSRRRRARSSTSLGWYDEDTGEVKDGIAIPTLLSLLAYHDPNATVRGLDAVPPDDRPPDQRDPLRVPDDGRDRHAAGAARRARAVRALAAPAAARVALVLPRARAARAAVGRRADLRLGRRPRSAASRGSSTA